MTTKEELMGNPIKDRATEHLSPSGAYKLVVTPCETGKGHWNYTEGLVYRKGDDEPIERVCRNYSSFPFAWVENHVNGHAYLICGEDYQGQTVIELDTGKRRDELSEGTEDGHGFCWADYEYESSMGILTVAGCIWACPYEYRFFDFSNPMEGWPELRDEPWTGAEADARRPTFEDGLIKVYQTADDDEDDCLGEVAAFKVFRREGNLLVVVDEWVSDAEKQRRENQEKARKEYEAKQAKFKAEDPLYLAHRELQKNPVLSPEDYASRGITHDQWCPDFDKQEGRWCQRIIKKGSSEYTVDLEWAMETGPIKLIVYKGGESFETLWFEHSVEGMQKAYAHACGLVS